MDSLAFHINGTKIEVELRLQNLAGIVDYAIGSINGKKAPWKWENGFVGLEKYGLRQEHAQLISGLYKPLLEYVEQKNCGKGICFY